MSSSQNLTALTFLTGGEYDYVTKSSLTPSRLLSGSKVQTFENLIFMIFLHNGDNETKGLHPLYPRRGHCMDPDKPPRRSRGLSPQTPKGQNSTFLKYPKISPPVIYRIYANLTEAGYHIVRLRQPKKPRLFSCIWVMRARMTRYHTVSTVSLSRQNLKHKTKSCPKDSGS